jgi:Holliday junction DNA helicase RuvA
MIASLQGVLEHKDGSHAVINVGGVGFLCLMSASSLVGLGKVGSVVRVETLLQLRTDALTLYGFASTEERTLFESLTSVSSVGGRLALAILSAYSPTELTGIIQSGDTARLTAVSGIGKKTAQRVILELQGSLESLAGGGAAAVLEGDSAKAEAMLALEAMGFSHAEIVLAVSAIKDHAGGNAQGGGSGTQGEGNVSELIRQALKRLG